MKHSAGQVVTVYIIRYEQRVDANNQPITVIHYVVEVRNEDGTQVVLIKPNEKQLESQLASVIPGFNCELSVCTSEKVDFFNYRLVCEVHCQY